MIHTCIHTGIDVDGPNPPSCSCPIFAQDSVDAEDHPLVVQFAANDAKSLRVCSRWLAGKW